MHQAVALLQATQRDASESPTAAAKGSTRKRKALQSCPDGPGPASTSAVAPADAQDRPPSSAAHASLPATANGQVADDSKGAEIGSLKGTRRTSKRNAVKTSKDQATKACLSTPGAGGGADPSACATARTGNGTAGGISAPAVAAGGSEESHGKAEAAQPQGQEAAAQPSLPQAAMACNKTENAEMAVVKTEEAGACGADTPATQAGDADGLGGRPESERHERLAARRSRAAAGAQLSRGQLPGRRFGALVPACASSWVPGHVIPLQLTGSAYTYRVQLPVYCDSVRLQQM